MTRKHKTPADNLILLADAFVGLLEAGVAFCNLFEVGPSQRRRQLSQDLRDQGQALRNRQIEARIDHEQEKTHLTIDRQVESSLKIDLLHLRIKREQWKQQNDGISPPHWTAEGYPDPGDVRHGIIPPAQKKNGV